MVIFHFELFFALLPPNLPKKSKFKKNEKNTWRHHHFTQVYKKTWSYAILFLRYGAWQMQLFFILSFFFLPFYALTAQKIKISKNEKNNCTIILQMCSINYDYMMYSSWDMVRKRWTDGWTDGWMERQKKWYIEVGVPPKKYWIKCFTSLWWQIYKNQNKNIRW